MNRNAIAKIVIYSLVALILTGILVSGLEDGIDFEGNGTPVDYEKMIDASVIDAIEINWAAGNVVVKAEDVNCIILRETADHEIKKPMTYVCGNRTLMINHSDQTTIAPFQKIQEKNLVVIVPIDWVCQWLEIDGAGLEVTINGITIRELNVDGAGIILNASGDIKKMDIDGAGCDVTVSYPKAPKELNLDGAGCVLNVSLPDGCGFAVEMDGLGCTLDTDAETRKIDSEIVYGDGNFKIEISGMGCDITIK
jgi:hypothetical protein